MPPARYGRSSPDSTDQARPARAPASWPETRIARGDTALKIGRLSLEQSTVYPGGILELVYAPAAAMEENSEAAMIGPAK